MLEIWPWLAFLSLICWRHLTPQGLVDVSGVSGFVPGTLRSCCWLRRATSRIPRTESTESTELAASITWEWPAFWTWNVWSWSSHEVLESFESFEAGLVFRVMIRLGPHRRAPGHGKGAAVICSEPLLPRRGPVLPGRHWKLESAAIPGYLQGALVEETWKRLETWRFGHPFSTQYEVIPTVSCCLLLSWAADLWHAVQLVPGHVSGHLPRRNGQERVELDVYLMLIIVTPSTVPMNCGIVSPSHDDKIYTRLEKNGEHSQHSKPDWAPLDDSW